MKITSAEFVTSATKKSQYPIKKLPEIAFVGRSNVGKSSLINNVLTRKSLAKVSKTPGKTRLINYFLINNKFYFVDLPGYGFAKVSPMEQEKWRIMIEDYLQENQQLKQILILIDLRHPLQETDIQMLQWAEYHQIDYTVVLTKSDGIKPLQIEKKAEEKLKLFHAQEIKVQPEKLIPYSIKNGAFKAKLWTELNKHLR
ncbi:MAG: YihA family ribosome biogenesis GTP-binding protein [Nitrospinae bacterium]|nr:YihA family ribosome biogenesis GTP-binding protein [Nitrospinota bacterium]